MACHLTLTERIALFDSILDLRVWNFRELILLKIFLSPSLVILWILRSKIGTMQLAIKDIVALMILALCREMVILHLIRLIIGDVFLLIVESFVLHEVSVSGTLSDLLPLGSDLFVLNLRETSFDGSN